MPEAKPGTGGRQQRRRPIRVATWNINSVRLRRPLLAELVRALDPDVLCLQETKCPDELFPIEELRECGFPHVAHRGMKGYNGVAVLSRLPFAVRGGDPDWCGRGDCRHLGVDLDAPGGPIEVHNFYVPAGGDVPDRDLNPKFAHKLNFVAEATAWNAARGPSKRSVLLGDLNIAPLEHDVWSHRQLLDVVSHTPVEVGGADPLAADRRVARRGAPFRARRPQALYVVVLPRARLASVGSRAAARPCLGQPGPRGRAPAP